MPSMPSPTHNESGISEKSLNMMQTLDERFHGPVIPSRYKLIYKNTD
jgi:hypothetical protein